MEDGGDDAWGRFSSEREEGGGLVGCAGPWGVGLGWVERGKERRKGGRWADGLVE
jgi:hypothetical protein